MNLSIATAQDFDYVKSMGLRFAREYPFPIEIDEAKVDALCWDFIEGDKTKKILILANDPHPIGLIAGRVDEVLFGRTLLGVEMMWWVDPEHRSGTTGWKLIEAFEYWAAKVGCQMLQLCTVQTPIADRLDKLYARKGYTLAERGYLKEI